MGSTVLSRRAAVRGAVWSIPAVTVATTAPAFAQASGSMALTNPVASYGAPDTLTFSATVEGTAGQAGVLTLTLTEANLFGSVTISGGAPGTVTRSPGGTFTLTFPVTPGAFTTTLDLGDDTLAGEFRGYRGDETALVAAISPTASEPTALMLQPLGNAEIEPVGASAEWISYTAVRVQASGLRLTADAQPSVGRLRIVLTMPTATYANANPPVVSNLALGWMEDPDHAPFEAAGGWIMRFVTEQSAHTSLTGAPAHRGPGAFSVDLDQDSTGFFRAERVPIDVTTDETAFGWGDDNTKIAKREPYVVLGPRPAPPA
jgi:hypothetical protein